MRRRGTPVSREALYEEVWTDAVTVVAPRYGLSDVGLVKICKKLGIPVPPRGYWAKLKAGRPTHKVPLPALPAGARDPSGPIPLSEQEAAVHARVRDALQQTRESQASISVPAELVDPHPLVRAAAARLKRRDGWDHPAGVRSAPKEVLDLQVTRNTLDRALLLMDTLLKSLEPSGFTAQVPAQVVVDALDALQPKTLCEGAEELVLVDRTPLVLKHVQQFVQVRLRLRRQRGSPSSLPGKPARQGLEGRPVQRRLAPIVERAKMIFQRQSNARQDVQAEGSMALVGRH